MSDKLQFEYEALRYIELRGDGSKLPARKWGGYSQDFDAAEHVYTHEDLQKVPGKEWGVVDIEDIEHGSMSLLVFDIDVHKAPEDFDVSRLGIPSDTLLVKSQNGGFHVYFKLNGYQRGELKESDFSMTADLPFDIDIRGSVVTHHVVAPSDIPGVNGTYEIVNDEPIKSYLRPSEACERITLDEQPLLEFDQRTSVGDFEFDRPSDAPDDMPKCYHAGLELRKAAPDDHPNTHKVNVLTALCGLGAGYSVEEVVDHFVNDYAPDDGDTNYCDVDKSTYQVKHLARQLDSGNYTPPSEKTLRDYGIFEADESCEVDCPIEFHGSPDLAKQTFDELSDDDDPWDYVRELYGAEDDYTKVARMHAADALECERAYMHIVETEKLWSYKHRTGYFVPDGKDQIHAKLEAELGSHYSISERNEIIDRIRARNKTKRSSLNAKGVGKPLLCVGNGVINLSTGELLPHDSKYKFTRGLEHDYDAEADSSKIVDFLAGITKRKEDWQTLVDHLAHGLMPGHPYRAFVITYGPGGNGKTQLGELFRAFVGEDNAAAVELQDLTGDDDFATGALPSAFINVGDDVSVSEIRNTSTLKTASGGGTLRANEKHEKKFDFKNEAAMFFSANEPPRIAEDKQSIADRLYPIEMPYRHVDNPDPENAFEREKVPGIAEKLGNDTGAMRGLLSLVVEHAQRLVETNGRYSMPEGPDERRAIYEAAADPIQRFALEYLEDADGKDMILKEDAYSVYTNLCDRDAERPARGDVFKSKISQQSSVDVEPGQTRSLTPGDSRDQCWKYVRFTKPAKELMPPRLIERYFPGADDEAGTEVTEADEPDNERAAFGAQPIRHAAQSLTGYVTVTAEIVTTRRLGETESGLKAVLKDQTGAIDVVSWERATITHLEELEGETIALQNAEVTEYDGVHQLTTVEGLTTITEIQHGVGYTSVEGAEDDNPVANNGVQSGLEDVGDSEVYEQTEPLVLDTLRTKNEMSVPELVGVVGESPEDVRSALDSLAEDGRVIVDSDGDSLTARINL